VLYKEYRDCAEVRQQIDAATADLVKRGVAVAMLGAAFSPLWYSEPMTMMKEALLRKRLECDQLRDVLRRTGPQPIVNPMEPEPDKGIDWTHICILWLHSELMMKFKEHEKLDAKLLGMRDTLGVPLPRPIDPAGPSISRFN
jgi:predicted NAD-dependent protein-ADP-ribosyltransferase YbiA (DUF1768 family)